MRRSAAKPSQAVDSREDDADTACNDFPCMVAKSQVQVRVLYCFSRIVHNAAQFLGMESTISHVEADGNKPTEAERFNGLFDGRDNAMVDASGEIDKKPQDRRDSGEPSEVDHL